MTATRIAILLTAVLLTISVTTSAEQKTDTLKLKLHYTPEELSVHSSRPGNVSVWNRITGLSNVEKIEIVSTTSPDGVKYKNDSICQQRTKNLEKALRKMFPSASITSKSEGSDWDGLLKILESSDKPYRDKVTKLINETPLWTYDSSGKLTTSRKQTLMILEGGSVWKQMRAEIFPEQNVSEITIYYHNDKTVPEIEIQPQMLASVETAVNPELQYTRTKIKPWKIDTEKSAPYKDFVLLKNNLLFDAALVANIGLEFRLGKNISLDLPFTYSPYSISDKYCVKTLSIQPSIRFWTNQTFNGFFISLFGHAGYYDIMLGDRFRLQNSDSWKNPVYGGGLGLGYRIRFGKTYRWGIEFDLGCGYAVIPPETLNNQSDSKIWWGPTKAGINITYAIARKD